MTEEAQPSIIPKELTPDEKEANRLADLPTAKLLDELTASIHDGVDFFGHQELLNRLVSGRLSDAKHSAAEAAGYQAGWEAMMDAYKAGTYFGQQGLDFLSWMLVTEKEAAEDLAKWKRMDAAATALGLRHDPTFCNAESFAYRRIKLDHGHRRFFLTKTNTLRQDLTPGPRLNLKTLRESFRDHAKRNGWK